MNKTSTDEIDQIFYRELRGKTVSPEQSSILSWAEKRLKPAISRYVEQRVGVAMTEPEIRQALSELNHIEDGRILATPEELIALFATQPDELEAKIAELEKLQKRYVEGGEYSAAVYTKLVEQRVAHLKHKLTKELQ